MILRTFIFVFFFGGKVSGLPGLSFVRMSSARFHHFPREIFCVVQIFFAGPAPVYDEKLTLVFFTGPSPSLLIPFRPPLLICGNPV